MEGVRHVRLSSTSPFSFSRISLRLSSSRASKYSRLLVSKSVETVSGLELTMMLLITGLPQSPGGMNAAIIKFNSLADADRTAADDHGFIALARVRLHFPAHRCCRNRGFRHQIRRRRYPPFCRPAGYSIHVSDSLTCSGSRSARVPIWTSEKPSRLASHISSGVSGFGEQLFLHVDDIHEFIEEPHIEIGLFGDRLRTRCPGAGPP